MAARERRDIEQLAVWALRDQGLGWGGERDRSREDFSDYGTLIDTSPSGSHPTINLLSDDDALLVKAAIDGLPRDAAALLIQYGRAGLRPDWAEEGVGSWQQDVDARGRRRWRWLNQMSRTGAREPLMVFVGLSADVVQFERAAYGLWWESLSALVAPLNLRLETHLATGPEALRQPWLERPATIHTPEGVEFAKAVRRPVREDTAAQMVARAQAPIVTRPTDWSDPNGVLHRDESTSESQQSRSG
jgi:hypothetical protein